MDPRSYQFSPRQSSPLVGNPSLNNSGMLQHNESHCIQASNAIGDGDYSEIEKQRARFYDLDFPIADEEYFEKHKKLDHPSVYESSLEKPQVSKNLPYPLETLHDKAFYLSHIVSHLYIAVESLDLLGALPVSVEEFKKARDSLTMSSYPESFDDLTTDKFEQQFYHDAISDGEEDDESDDEADDEGEIDTGRSTPVNKMPSSSAAVINARHWSIELMTLLSTNFPIPILLRASLCKVYFAICLSQGQSLKGDIFVQVYGKLMEEKPVLIKHGLVLDWEMAYRICFRNFPHENSRLDHYNKADFKKLLNICFMSNTFFESNAVSTIFSRLMSLFSTSNASLAVSCLYGLLPMNLEPYIINNGKVQYHENDVRYYIPSLFNLWSSVSRAENVDLHIIALISRISESSLVEASKPGGDKVVILGNYGIFDETQFKVLILNLQHSLKTVFSQTTKHSGVYYQSFANMFVFSIVGNCSASDDCSIASLRTMLNSLRSFVHPSNSGPWSGLLSRLVLSIVSQYHKRLQLEKDDPLNNVVSSELRNLPDIYKLNNLTNTALVEMLLPLIQIGVHAKKDNIVDRYINSLSLLCRVKTKDVLDIILFECYSSLEATNSSHRLLVILKELAAVMRYIVSTPVYRVHVMRLLMETLPGIDSNDLVKSMQTLHLIAATATFIPFSDLTRDSVDSLSTTYDFTQQHILFLEEKFNGNLETFNVANAEFFFEEEYEKLAFISSTYYFKEFMRIFCERIFLLLENLPDPQKTADIEAKIAAFIPKTIYVLIQSLSDECFFILSSQVFDFVSNKVYHTLSHLVGRIIGALVKRDLSSEFPKYVKLFVLRIREEIIENGAGVQRGEGELSPRDQPLLWYTILLSYAISQAGEMAVDCKSDLIRISDLLNRSVNGPVSLVTCLIPYQLLITTTTTRLTECRIVSDNSSLSSVEEAWGGSQFDEKRFSKENLSFGWHIPNNREVEFAISFFESQSNAIMDSLSNHIETPKADNPDISNDLLFSDKVIVDLRTLGRCIAGISHLFDPSYKEQTSDASKPQLLKSKLHSLEAFRKRFDSHDTSGKSSPVGTNFNSRSPSIVHSNLSETLEYVQDADLLDKEDVLEACSVDEEVITEENSVHIAEIPCTTKLSPSVSRSGKEEAAESLKAVLSFKNRKIYHSNYFFGELKSERDSNPNYIRLHELRNNIGRYLHKIFEVLMKKFPNNTKLMKVLLDVMKIWICDVGDETVLNISGLSTLSFSYLESIQYITRMNNPFTRITFGHLLEAYHKQRIHLFAGSRIMTPIDMLLLTDIIKLSSSPYSEVTISVMSVLNASLKLVIGCYGVLIKRLMAITEAAIEKSEEKAVQHALAVLHSRRFKGRISSDFRNLPRIITILNRCMTMESNTQLTTIVSSLFSTIINKIEIPSSVCVIERDYIAAIRPPDEYIGLEIKALKISKENKRDIYLKNIATLVLQLLETSVPSNFWKMNYFNLSLLINLENDLEVPLYEGVPEKIIEFTLDTHPTIFRVCLRGLSELLSKINTLSSFDYDLTSIYTKDYVPSETIVINTQPSEENDGNYTNTFKKEMSNLEHPTYFIDNKRNFFWLFWSDQMHVLDSKFHNQLKLRDNDKKLLEKLGLKIDRKFFTLVVQQLVQEAETDEAFHTVDVQLISSIVSLSDAGFTPLFATDEWFPIINSIYVSDAKDSHLVVCEIIAGLLTSSSHTTEKFSSSRDQFISKMLRQILLKDINLETRGIWVVFSWWIPSNVDVRRFPLVFETLMDFVIDKESDSSFNESTRLMIVKHLIVSTSFKFPKLQFWVKKCLENMDQPYELVREQIASLMTALFMIAPINPHPNVQMFLKSNDVSPVGDVYFKRNDLFDKGLVLLFENLQLERAKVKELPVAELLKTSYIYMARTVVKFLKNVLFLSCSAGLVPYLCHDIIPFILDLTEMREICILTGISPQRILIAIACIPYRQDQLDEVVDYITSFNTKSAVWYKVQVFELFSQMFYLRQYLALSKQQRSLIFNFVFKLLFHENVEVRETAAKILSGIMHTWDVKEVDDKISKIKQKLSKILTKNRKELSKEKNQQNDDVLVKLHGATLGFGAMIDAFPYISPIPRWMPAVLTILANRCSNIPGHIGRAAKDFLSKFKKVRQDTWHIDSRSFTADELQDLEGVLWTSYFV